MGCQKIEDVAPFDLYLISRYVIVFFLSRGLESFVEGDASPVTAKDLGQDDVK